MKKSGPWCGKIVLAPKPHQETVTDIRKFVWRQCVNYRPLNEITKPFIFAIPRCEDALENISDGSKPLYTISVDAKSGFHQLAVHPRDQEKLAFIAPDSNKYCYTVLPFGPCNGPAFYTFVNQQLALEYDAIFKARHPNLVGQVGRRNVIDVALLFVHIITAVLLYFRCVCEVFKDYRLSFNADKCDFFKTRTEWVGQDSTEFSNHIPLSKFDTVNDWPLPLHGTSLASFCSLACFYRIFIPLFTPRCAALRKLAQRFPPNQSLATLEPKS